MAIKASSASQIDALIADLLSASDVARESAVARLIVIGARAVERLVSFVGSNASASGRAAALRALEAIADPRSVEATLDALDDDNVEVAAAAASTARVHVLGLRGTIAVDRLTTTAVDSGKHPGTRLAAMQALAVLEPSTVAPLWKALLDDDHPDVRTLAGRLAGGPDAPGDDSFSYLTRALERGLSDDPAALREHVTRAGTGVALGTLHQIIERVREREAVENSPDRRLEWTRARGTIHAALAARGSRLALYDLRETLEAAGSALPVEFLSALSAVGNASCLEAIAAAYTRSSSTREDWWRRHLKEAFRTIVDRETLTGRHAVMRKLAKRWPVAFHELRRASPGR